MREGLKSVVELESLITDGARERVVEQLALGVSPILGAQKWARAGVVDFTAAYLAQTANLPQSEVAAILALAYEGQARRDMELAEVLQKRFKKGEVLAGGFASAALRATLAQNKAMALKDFAVNTVSPHQDQVQATVS